MDPATDLFLRYRENGDLAALGQVFDLLAPRLLSLALHLSRNPADAEDALQATFVVAMRKAGVFDGRQQLGRWLAGILAGEVRNASRRHGRGVDDPLGELPDAGVTPAAAAQRAELVEVLRTQIGTLPDEQRQALLLQLEHGLRPAEIAEVLGVPPGTVRVRVHRGLQALKRLLPPSLASAVLATLAPRGLAAIRQAVLRDAAALAAAATGTGLGGVLLMKKVWLAVVAVLCASAAWWSFVWSAPAVPMASTGEQVAATAAPTVAGHQDGERHTAVPVDAPPARQALPTTGGLRVHVQGAGSGEPLAGVRVLVQAAQGVGQPRLADVRTGADGLALLDGIPAGDVLVECLPTGSGGIFDRPGQTATVPPGDTAEVTMTLSIGTVQRGRTVDERRAPVAGAVLLLATGRAAETAFGGGTDSAERVPAAWRQAGRSREDGTFEIPVVAGEYLLGAFAPGHAAAAMQRLAGTELEFVLPVGGSALVGTVCDAGGAPVAAAHVGVAAAATEWRRDADGKEIGVFAPMSSSTAADGSFALPAVGPGRVVVEVLAPGFASLQQTLDVTSGGIGPLAFVLQREVALQVVVLDAVGAPVGDARLSVWCGDRQASNPTREGMLTRADGTCPLHGLPPGPLRVQAVHFGTGRAVLDIDARAEEVRRIELRLAPRVGICGILLDAEGRPAAGAVVLATDEQWQPTAFRDRPQQPFQATAGPDGRFELRDLGPYPFRLQARAADGARLALLGEHVLPGPELRTFVLTTRGSAATLAGCVRGPDGAPLAGARVSAWRDGVVNPRGERTDAAGRFELTDLDAGTWSVRAAADSLLGAATGPVDLANGERRDLGSLHLRRGASLVVRVGDADGRPWTAAPPTVFLRTDDQRVHNGTWRDGATLRFGPLPTCRGQLLVVDDNLVAGPSAVELTEDTESVVELRVHIGAMRILRFEGASRPAAATLQFQVVDSGGRELLRRGVDWPAGAGAVDVRVPLPVGQWQVVAQDGTGRRFVDQVAVKDLAADERPLIVRAAQ